ncbi:hypothetical protein [Winogradskyella haliclonae]|uniref:hypothetical protein n=1 Tax=Winogradskyella haliclonae TaxID=2048558 RepID=UPI001664B970|nr:hypothetical protein [Winogradskyella haliclonae]
MINIKAGKSSSAHIISLKCNKNFVLFAAICCFLTVITTIGIHWRFTYPEMSFEERLNLFKNSKYVINRWWIIVHCLLVFISMLGILIIHQSKGFIKLGLCFFGVFSLTEIFRQFLVLFYLNGLREKLILTADELIKNILLVNIDNFYFLSDALFNLFILAFALGNLFYGISLIGSKRLDCILGSLFIFWAAMNFSAFLNEYWGNQNLSSAIDFLSVLFQPLMRAFIGFWLLHHIYPSLLSRRNKKIGI